MVKGEKEKDTVNHA